MQDEKSNLENAARLIKKMKVDLADLIPQSSKFSLQETGKEYHLRPINLQDEVWLAETFGARLQKIIAEVHFASFVRIAYHQMQEADKASLMKKSVTIINEEGDQETSQIGGYKLLLLLIQGGLKEKQEIVQAVFDTFGMSKPFIEDIEKKSLAMEAQEASELTGENALTSSPQNMDGPQNKSAS